MFFKEPLKQMQGGLIFNCAEDLEQSETF